MFNAELVMKKDMITVSPDTPIFDAMKTLVSKGISGLPVVDKDMNLLGIITEKDMLPLLVNREDGEEKQGVADFMNHDVKFFKPTDTLVDICDFLIKNPYRRVPIVKDGKLVGIIARRDILAFILKLQSSK